MKKSFTLIELLVVLGLMMLLTIGSIIGLSASSSRSKAKSTAEQVKVFLMDARSDVMMPQDNVYGMSALQVRIYPFYGYADPIIIPGDPDPNARNVIKIFSKATVGSITNYTYIDEFKMPSGLYLDTDNASPWGNTNCGDACGSSSLNFYYYFYNLDASNSNTIGQIIGTNSQHTVYLKVGAGDASGTGITWSDVYKLEIDKTTGNITLCQWDSVHNVCIN